MYPDIQIRILVKIKETVCNNTLLNCFCISLTAYYVCSLMKVPDHLSQSQGTPISFEILPPLKGKGINALWEHLDPLLEFKPEFINVTYHRSESMFKKNRTVRLKKLK